MTFVDTNVLIYAVGRRHPLKEKARLFFSESVEKGHALCTSAEVLQELMHVYLPVGRLATLDAALEFAAATLTEVWPVEAEDVALARELLDSHPGLKARDLLHLASCERRGVSRIMTFDRALAGASRPA